MFEGESKRLHVQVLDSGGDPFDLTGIVAIQWEMQRDLTTNGGSELTKALGNGITIIDPTEGRLRIDIDPTDTIGLSGHYYHEARLTDALGHVVTILTGRAKLIKTAIG